VRDEYYPQFLEKFPTLEALANAPLDEVLAAWSGLGYYSRARNLHATAQIAQINLPQTEEELLILPGIGQYTASAICSFGYHQNVPVVDTNIARVIKRFFALLNPSHARVLKSAKELLNHSHARAHNLALMDLGSLVCLPKNPQCGVCPLAQNCQGKSEPELYTQTKKTQYESLELFYGVWIKENKIALTQASGNMYKGMLELPTVEPIEDDFIGSFKHSYTKYRLTVNLYAIDETRAEIVWTDINKLELAPISSLTKKAQKFFS
jgi:A/G-specific adenine glycosylase